MEHKIIGTQRETVKRINDALCRLVKQPGQNCADDDYPWIVFLIDDTEYAINARYIQSVAILYEIIPYEEAPIYCPGVTWDRNGIIRLMDLRALLGRGEYVSSFKQALREIPTIIIVEPNGIRRGFIVDKIIAPDSVNYLISASVVEVYERLMYIKGLLEYDPEKSPAFVIEPESFNILEFEDISAKIYWKGRIDMEMKIFGSEYSPK